VLVVGESGTGKSMLVRAIAGLWPWGAGEIQVKFEGLFFMPQDSYVPLGTLRRAVTYPLSPEEVDMGRTAVSTQIGFMATIACADIRADLPRITCPTLVITTEESGLASVGETRAWQETIPKSELRVLPGNSYHVAASDAERCAEATIEFIERNRPGR
jgi:pimeloyl-ACP methyl ester carboxylesterase